MPTSYYKAILKADDLFSDPSFYQKIHRIALQSLRLFVQSLYARQNYLGRYAACSCTAGNIRTDVLPFLWGFKIDSSTPARVLVKTQKEGLLLSKKISDAVKLVILECPLADQCLSKYNDKYMDILIGNRDRAILESVWQQYLPQFYPKIFLPLFGYNTALSFQKSFADFLKLFSTAPFSNDLNVFPSEEFNMFKPLDFPSYMGVDKTFSNVNYLTLPNYFSQISADSKNPSLLNPSIFNPSVYNPSLYNPSLYNPSLYNPTVYNPLVFKPSILNGITAESNANQFNKITTPESNFFNSFNPFVSSNLNTDPFGQSSFNLDFNELGSFDRINGGLDGFNRNGRPFGLSESEFDKLIGDHRDGTFQIGNLNGTYHTISYGGSGKPTGTVVTTTFGGPNTSGGFQSLVSASESDDGAVSSSSSTSSFSSSGSDLDSLLTPGPLIVNKRVDLPPIRRLFARSPRSPKDSGTTETPTPALST